LQRLINHARRTTCFGHFCVTHQYMQDILLENDDLSFRNGDLLTGTSDRQHQKHILVAYRGQYRQYPALGAGIADLLSDDDPNAVLLEAKKNLKYDRMKVGNIRLEENGRLIVDANY